MKHSSIALLKSTHDTNVHLRDSDIIILKYDNISKNECDRNSALWCYPIINSSVSYTSFENNTAINLSVICLHNKIYMDACNVIGNSANSNALIFVSNSLDISNSCLIENTKTMFNFGGGSSSCVIINCTIDSTDKIGGGSVIVDSNSIPPKSFINNLDNNGCFSMNDSDDTKDSNSKCVCMTFNMIRKRCNMPIRMDDYIFLIY